ncbi:sensor histidine kinase [Dankookia sp. GCM10030260]|uniref:sensor histidine kinase n=1 Tax=Dankookia sp. GCM10030260 TaxID=3273390 RepID=UPI00361870D3
MDSRTLIDGAIYATRHWPVWLRYAATCALVAAVLGLRLLADPILGDHERSLLFLAAILLSATLFDRGSGILATLLSAMVLSYMYMPPRFSLVIGSRTQLVSLLLFVVIGVLLASIVEAMHRAIEALQAAQADLQEVQRGRALLLEEFRHRTRNDLGSLVGILLLRARAASSEAARDGLREAADHALALARVHTRLAKDSVAAEDATTVDTREFIVGLCDDLTKAFSGDGLRPVFLHAEAEPHRLSTERSVQLGLVLNEAITNAFKYAFPEGRGGQVQVRFRRQGEQFVLTVVDDGPGVLPDGEVGETPPAALPQGSGLGTRLLRALAAQLRGSFNRHPGEAGLGTVVELHFPVDAPRPPSPARRG